MEDTFSQVLDLFPEPIKKIAGFGDDLSTAGFLNGEFMHLIGPLIMGAFGITIGSTILASEEENKTISGENRPPSSGFDSKLVCAGVQVTHRR